MPDDLDALRREIREIRTALESLQADVKRIRSALGTLCLIMDGSHHMQRPKLESVDLNTLETFYMPAAFCLDLSRKLDYVFIAMRGFADDADRDLARRLLGDNREVYKGDASWEEAARDTERVFLEVLREIYDDHRRLLQRRAR
jgi:hypothetical protein